MEIRRLSFSKQVLAVFLFSVIGVFAVHAQEVASDPSGFFRISLQGNSDTLVSLPFLRPASASGLVSSLSDNAVTVSGSRIWTANEFTYSAVIQPNYYFLVFITGSREGCYFTVTGNTADTVTLDLNGGSLTGVAQGDRVAIVPYWSLGTVFPGGKGVHASTLFSRLSEVFLMPLDALGINLSAQKIYYFYNSAWRQVNRPNSEAHDDDPLPIDGFFIVRHNKDENTELTVTGSVVMNRWVIALTGNGTAQQDNIVSLPRPTEMTLDESGLINSGVFKSSTLFSITDMLMVFDNTISGKNKSASEIFYYYSGAWRKLNRPKTEDWGSATVFKPGTGVIIRKNIGSLSGDWSNDPNY